MAKMFKRAVPKLDGFQDPTFRKAEPDRSFGCFEWIADDKAVAQFSVDQRSIAV